MLDFLQEGGIAIWFILLFGVVTVGVAVAHVIRPERRRAAFFRALSVATVLASLTGFASGVGALMHKVPATPEWAHSPDRTLILMLGLGESLANAILGFGLLAIAWFAFAFGERRRDA